MASTPAKIDTIKLIYGELPKDVARAAEESVERIKEKIFKTGIEIGRELNKLKATIPHGVFGRLLGAAFGESVRNLQRYMAAARVVDEYGIDVNLPLATLETLSQAPKAEVLKIAEELWSDEPPTARDIAARLGQSKRNQKKQADKKVVPSASLPAKAEASAAGNEKMLPIRFTTETGSIIRQQQPPVNRKEFWARIRNKGDRFVVVELKAQP